ncbi:MAG: OmpA family protein [Caulobacteraceae bacterium]
MRRFLTGFALALLAGGALAAPGPGERLNFLACPLIRDTTPNCWIAEYAGETYYLGAQRGPTDSYLPQMKHQVLVEGVVSDAPRVCGGVVIRPARVSVMPELDLTCDKPVLPAVGLPPPAPPVRTTLASRPSDAVGGIGSFMRAEPPKPPFTVRDFKVDFDFDSEILSDQMQRRMIEALTYVRGVNPKKITVTGYRAATLLSNGRTLTETEVMAERRARKVARILINLGAPEQLVSVGWTSAAEPADMAGADRRRATITVEPGAEAGVASR